MDQKRSGHSEDSNDAFEELPSIVSDSLADVGATWAGEVLSRPGGVQRRNDRLLRLEARIVSRILKFFSLQESEKVILEECASRTGQRRLSWSMFLWRFPDFPVYLVPDLVLGLHEEPLTRFLSPKGFLGSKLFKAWERSREKIPAEWLHEGRATGVVFEFYHSQGPGLFWVVHDRESACSSWAVDVRRSGSFWRIQPLVDFLGSLNWCPM